MYDGASLTCQQALGGRLIETSRDAGWKSILLEKRTFEAGFSELESYPTTDTRLTLSLTNNHKIQLLRDGQWRTAQIHRGALSVTAAGNSDRLTVQSETSPGTLSLFLPENVLEMAAEHLRRAGSKTPREPLDRLVFQDPAVRFVIEALMEAMRSGATNLYAEQTAHWLALHLLVHHKDYDPYFAGDPGEHLTDRRLIRVIDLIKARYADPLSLDELASEACISKFHLVRKFQARTGMSPHTYIVSERMAAARRLLAETDLQISEIARRVGYNRSTQFGVAFKRANGQSPSAYRALRTS